MQATHPASLSICRNHLVSFNNRAKAAVFRGVLPNIKIGVSRTFLTSRVSVVSSMVQNEVDVKNPVIPASWIGQHLSDVKVLDATWFMPNEGRNAHEEYLRERIRGSHFFDIDAICDAETDLPHMLPSEGQFSRAVQALGLSNDDKIVVYDKKGIFSAARAWWTFRVFGHENVWVVDGGFPACKLLGLPVDSGSLGEQEGAEEGSKEFTTNFQHDLVWTADQVIANLETKSAQLVDARSAGRFFGIDPEPRVGIRGGHIPLSLNVPFGQVLTENGYLKSEAELKSVFENSGVDLTKPIITSCGTGVTASILALAFHRLGLSVPVYDGSWTEWGSRSDTPVVKKE